MNDNPKLSPALKALRDALYAVNDAACHALAANIRRKSDLVYGRPQIGIPPLRVEDDQSSD